MRKGIYRTYDGNAVYVSGPNAKSAYDMDAAERVPISEVDPKSFVRTVAKGETPSSQR